MNFLYASEQRATGSERVQWSQEFSVSGLIRHSTVLTDKNHKSRPVLLYIILHILTHGSRCVVSAWIPVSNYLSASAHWCHSFPVITQSPACQGQVTSRWAWLVLNGALSPILSPGDRTASQQTQHLGLCPSSPFSFSYGQYFTTDNDPLEIVTEGILLHVFHMTRCQFLFTREQLITVDKLMWKVSFWVHLVSPNLIQPVHYTCQLHLGC